MIFVKQEGITFDDVLLMPQHSTIKSRQDVDLVSLVTNEDQFEIPIIAANMDTVTGYEMALAMHELGGLGIVHRFMSPEEQAGIIRSLYSAGVGSPAAAIGVNSMKNGRLKKLVGSGAEIICIDVAHSDHTLVYDILDEIRNEYDRLPFSIIVGNIATYGAATRLLTVYGDMIGALKVGIGPGSLCSTRIVTGHGVPQITAIDSVRKAIDSLNSDVKLIADGGIRNSGDIVKALAAGADSVMIGGLLAGCDETPGNIITVNERRCKVYRGMASYDAMADIGKNTKAAEGFSAVVSCKGPVKPIVEDLISGIRSGCSYSGARDLNQLRKNAQFIKVSPATVAENHPHLFNRLKD